MRRVVREQTQAQTAGQVAETGSESEVVVPRQLRETPTSDSLTLQVERAAPQPPGRRAARERFEDALLGAPGETSQFAGALDNFARLCAAGWTASEALNRAAVDARPALRSLFEEASGRVSAGSAISDALAGCSANLPPLLVPALRAWERNGQRDADLKVLARELRRLGEIQQRNTFFQIQYFMQRAERREQKAMAAPTTRRAQKSINSSRGGIARRSKATMRWTDLFASLWRCGVPISEALEAAGEGCGNNYVRHVLRGAAERTRAGVPLSLCMAETRLLSPGLLDRLRTGETSGRMDETLEEFARVLEQNSGDLGTQSLVMRRLLPAILITSAVVLISFAAVMGNPMVGLIVAAAFLLIAFVAWEIVFRQSVGGGPAFGIGKREPKGSGEKADR